MRSYPSSSKATLFAACGALLALAPGSVRGAEVILQNDSVPPGTALTSFITGERVASWLTIPTTGHIVGVQIFWGSMFGGSPPSTETAITISSGATFPTPGTTLATIAAPTLVDTAGPTEFRHLDPPANNVPLSVPVTAGQVIVVDLEFLNTNAGNQFAGSIEYDADGIQTGVNSVFASGVWTDAASLGVPGDFGIRAILVPIPEPSGAWLALAAAGILLVSRRRGVA
ncbi:MAG: hypothetical protein HKN82_07450 [Akkermansiaceae bacterium]|nr:hypothetical protein [Akkermansiaceae bacterium]NNM31289.1 hypothetical protein [Akkermansiaceae bacterium]